LYSPPVTLWKSNGPEKISLPEKPPRVKPLEERSYPLKGNSPVGFQRKGVFMDCFPTGAKS
jgi:hypothetical protein